MGVGSNNKYQLSLDPSDPATNIHASSLTKDIRLYDRLESVDMLLAKQKVSSFSSNNRSKLELRTTLLRFYPPVSSTLRSGMLTTSDTGHPTLRAIKKVEGANGYRSRIFN